METSSSVSSSNLQMDYMTLLVAQMKNQNPLEPLDNNEMASQLAQFSQLQQLEEMNSNLSQSNINFEEILRMERKFLKYNLELEKARADKQAAVSFITYLMGN